MVVPPRRHRHCFIAGLVGYKVEAQKPSGTSWCRLETSGAVGAVWHQLEPSGTVRGRRENRNVHAQIKYKNTTQQ
jgi:hypothetical protein